MLLVTGFEPFGGLERNSSADVAQALAAGDVVTSVLPVEYREIRKSLEALLTQPFDAVVLLGLAVSRSVICPERVAIVVWKNLLGSARTSSPSTVRRCLCVLIR